MIKLFSFIKKEFRHILRDKLTLLILFGIPIVQIMLFGYVISNEIKNIPIAFIDLSNDNLTSRLQNKIISSGYFIEKEKYLTYENIEKLFKSGKIKEVIVFEPNFEKKYIKQNKANIQLVIDATDANTANIIASYTAALIMNFVEEQNSYQQKILDINIEQRMFYNEQQKSSYLFVPGTIAVILMLICAMLTSVSITREKEFGSMSILLISPLKPIHIIIGKVTPYFILSILIASTILAIGHFVFQVPIKGSLVLLFAETLLYMFLSLSLGIFISIIAKSQQFAMFMSMLGLMLPSILLSGFIFPIENMPSWLQIFCQIAPPRWFIEIIRGIMLKGVGLSLIWKQTLILIFMTLFFITLSVKKFKIREM